MIILTFSNSVGILYLIFAPSFMCKYLHAKMNDSSFDFITFIFRNFVTLEQLKGEFWFEH